RIPIGCAARNRSLYIVHPDGTDVPRGVPGELCVAGPGLALGYHRRPELTAEKFTDTLGDLPERVYRTGDRVVLDEADRIVYIDRGDRQIKHAGYRIELSEIELALQRCDGVADAVVVHTTERNDSQLTAFYTGEAAPDETGARRALSAKLPHYMVPHRLIRRRSLPITAHGKVDRRRLAAEVRPVEPPVPSPGGADEAILAAFRAVLNVPDLRATDDFFEAGAQSLQAIAVVRRLREAGMELQVGELYRHPTAEGLSKALGRAPQEAARPRPEREPLVLEPARLRLMVEWAAADARRTAESFAEEAPSYEFPLGALARLHRSSGAEAGGFMHTVEDAEPGDLAEALAALAARHEALRSRVDGDRFAVLDPARLRPLAALVPVADLRRIDRAARHEFADALARALGEAPFDGGLPWRCVIVREGDRTARLVWAFHHGVFDGTSAGILRGELARLLRGEELEEARPYSRFLTAVDSWHEWESELDSFDYGAWIEANRAVVGAVADAETPTGRLSLPLEGRNPLELALHLAHEQLSRHSGRETVAVGLVADCRRWRSEDYTACVGEFLDVVPVLLRGEGDQETASRRLELARRQGLHYVQSLTRTAGPEGPPAELRAAYRGAEGRLGLALVNFQGHLDPEEVPESGPHGPTPAAVHLNIWHDDDSLHLEWASAGAEAEPAGARA
ncbi:MAG TPA: condensation domain-containing protein, partial [Glycomyces sp.]|nr:condensation domain-containing protein [Glycomyces sp.]